MNYLDAMNLAATAAQAVTSGVTPHGVAQCALIRTGLIVFVYREIGAQGLAGVAVHINDMTRVTDENGLVGVHPIEAGDHTVHLERGMAANAFSPAEDRTCSVALGECPVCAIPMQGFLPRIRILWDRDRRPVPGVSIELADSGAPVRITNEDGIAAWQQAVEQATHQFGAVALGADHYGLFDGPNMVREVAIASDALHTFTIRRQHIQFRVQRVTRGAPTEVPGARIMLDDIAEVQTCALAGGQALATFEFPVGPAGPAESWKVASLVPDDSQDVYEVVEVSTQ